MNALSNRRRRARGFSLIEVLVAIVIFSVGMLGVVGLQARAIQLSVDSEDRNRAAQLADDIVATMWTQGTTDAALGHGDGMARQGRRHRGTAGALPGAAATVSAPARTASSR